jgi:hypothetical protein
MATPRPAGLALPYYAQDAVDARLVAPALSHASTSASSRIVSCFFTGGHATVAS